MIKAIRNTAIVAALFVSTFVTSPQASADEGDQLATQICETLSAAPYDRTIEAVGTVLMTDGGLDAETAAKVIIVAVLEYCPDNAPVIQHYIDNAGTGA